ncbi:MAG: hypothetical protein H6R34_521 [Bacteroidetes bacterium]|nr:hypothetical protein [Bacteroidota bacterium]
MKLRKRIQSLHRIQASPSILINSIFLVVLLGILSYSALFSAARNNYPIPSSIETLKKGKEISWGLSRSFSELMRGRIDSARMYNEHGPRIFLFFLVQVFMRLFFLFLVLRNHYGMTWVYLDAGTSIVLFVIAFWPFICRFKEVVVSVF